jgi:LmbE family N-acetylglucosaminyl deacetylase
VIRVPTRITDSVTVPTSAMAIVAHPDDAEFHCGATLAKWARAGTTIHHLVLTDGSKGTWDPTADTAVLVATRRREQMEAAEALGCEGEVVFVDRVDGELVADHACRAEVAKAIRRLRPELVLGHDPWRRHRLHPDHRAAGQLTIDGIVAARDPFFHREQLREGLSVHRPAALLLFEAEEANHLEWVSEADLQRKLAALEAHRSQMHTTHLYAVADRSDPLGAFRRRERSKLVSAAGRAGASRGMAEAYHLITGQL